MKREKCDIARARTSGSSPTMRFTDEPASVPTPRGDVRAELETPVIDSCSSACVLLNPPGVLAREYQLSSRGDSPGSACEDARHASHTCARSARAFGPSRDVCFALARTGISTTRPSGWTYFMNAVPRAEP